MYFWRILNVGSCKLEFNVVSKRAENLNFMKKKKFIVIIVS